MELGRWKSSAWRYYLLHTGRDLCAAGAQMWASARSQSPTDELLRVGDEASPGPVCVAQDDAAGTQAGLVFPCGNMSSSAMVQSA
jgi:hypothetical protein